MHCITRLHPRNVFLQLDGSGQTQAKLVVNHAQGGEKSAHVHAPWDSAIGIFTVSSHWRGTGVDKAGSAGTELQKKMKDQGLTIIPVRLFISDSGYAKLEIALAKGKKEFDKREAIKERDVKKELMRKVR